MRFPFRQTIHIAKYIARKKKKGVVKFPLVLMLEPLHACNLSCSGCGRIKEYSDTASKMVPLDTCLNAAAECDAPVVSICGGEPLLYPKIKELVEGLIKQNRVVYLCTNGQILDKKLDIFRPHPFFNINIHLDGPEKTHDLIVEKIGAYKKAVNSIRLALSHGFTVCTNTTIYKQTNISEIKNFINDMIRLGVKGILLSPSYNYRDVSDQTIFLTRNEIIEKFKELGNICNRRKIWSTPLYLDFLNGKREFECTPWGNPTYNIKGWKAPCYLITDGHYKTFEEFMHRVDWRRYGPGRDERCSNCMVHCGFEPTVALKTGESLRDAIRMTIWTLF